MRSNRPPSFERLAKRDGVRVFEIAAHRQTTRDSRHGDAQRFDDLRQIKRCRLAIHGGIGGDDDLLDRMVAKPVDQLLDPQRVRANAIERRDGAVEHMVEASVLLRFFYGNQIRRLFDNAYLVLFALRATADPTEGCFAVARFHFAETKTAPTKADLAAQFADAISERENILLFALEHMKGQPRRGLFTDARQL